MYFNKYVVYYLIIIFVIINLFSHFIMSRFTKPVVFFFPVPDQEYNYVLDPSNPLELSEYIFKENVYKDKNLTKNAGYIKINNTVTQETNTTYLLRSTHSFHNILSKSLITYNLWNKSDIYQHFQPGFKQRFICTINDGFSTWQKLAIFEVLPNATRKLTIYL